MDSAYDTQFILAVKAGDVELAKKYEDQADPEYRKHVMFLHAACAGHLEIIKWNVSCGYAVTDDTFMVASRNGHQNIIAWGSQNKSVHWPIILSSASAGGRLYIIRHAHGNKIPIYPSVYTNALHNGHDHTIKWLEEVTPPMSEKRRLKTETLIEKHSVNGPCAVVWCINYAVVLTVEDYKRPLECGHLGSLIRLLDLGLPLNDGMYKIATRDKSCNSLTWIHEKGCPKPEPETISGSKLKGSTRSEIALAIKYGNIYNLRWLIDHGFTTVKDACALAAGRRKDSVEMLELLVHNGYELNLKCTRAAAIAFNTDHLVWLLDRGCPIDKDLCIKLVQGSVDRYNKIIDDQPKPKRYFVERLRLGIETLGYLQELPS